MNYIIDGFNLGFKIPSIADWIKKGDTEKAINLILNFINNRISPSKNRIIVVFDGKHGGRHSFPSINGITVKFSKKPQTADDIIREFLRGLANASAWTVITADSEIIYTARDMGAAVMPTGQFVRKSAGSPSHTDTRENIQKYEPGNVDVAYWLEQFGKDEDD